MTPIPPLHATMHTTKCLFGFTIFKISALVNNSFKCKKLSSHLVVHSSFISFFYSEVIRCVILEKIVMNLLEYLVRLVNDFTIEMLFGLRHHLITSILSRWDIMPSYEIIRPKWRIFLWREVHWLKFSYNWCSLNSYDTILKYFSCPFSIINYYIMQPG